MSKDKSSADDIEYLIADGGVAQLSSVNKQADRLLGFTKVKALKFELFADKRLFVATRGLMAVNNSNISEPNTEPGRFGLNRRCIATLRDERALEMIEADFEQGDSIEIDLGGYSDEFAGNPVPIKGTIELLGKYRNETAAVLNFGANNRVILTQHLTGFLYHIIINL